ncbi:MAG: zf-HC2 domain-containing protein [Planctomycetota bacterium]
MDCEEARKYIHPFLDDELDVEANLDVLEHINFCTECSERFEEEKDLRELIRASLLRTPKPEGLADRICQTLPRRETRRRPLAAMLVVGGIFATFAVLAFSGDAIRDWLLPSSESSLMLASADRHGKFLRDELPMSIVSQDPEAVKAYFRAKFGFPLHVQSLAAEHFQLVGGCLCHLMGRPAACVIYHRPGGAKVHACTLALFMLADKPLLSSSHATRIEGNLAVGSADKKAVVIWRQGGIVSACVADSAEGELIHLARLLQAPQGSTQPASCQPPHAETPQPDDNPSLPD